MAAGRRQSHSNSPSKSAASSNDYFASIDLATFGGRLSKKEADTTHTAPGAIDLDLFTAAATKTRPSTATKVVLNLNKAAISSFNHRVAPKKRKALSNSIAPVEATTIRSQVRTGHSPRIRSVHFGRDVIIEPWYSAPYPEEYYNEHGTLWICEYCLRYMRSAATVARHREKCHMPLPPGDEIYRDENVSVFEVNGRKSKIYCQNLCLLAKMFLDHKTLYYDVDPFLFYVLVEWQRLPADPTDHLEHYAYSFVGYFSKEKDSPSNYNVSCILTMPHHQRKGYGGFLIDFSYLLTKREAKLGSPEKPLSDLGLFSYVSYWRTIILEEVDARRDMSRITVEELCDATGMTANDVLATLEYLKFIHIDERGAYFLRIDVSRLDEFRRQMSLKPFRHARPEYLLWTPYLGIR